MDEEKIVESISNLQKDLNSLSSTVLMLSRMTEFKERQYEKRIAKLERGRLKRRIHSAIYFVWMYMYPILVILIGWILIKTK